MQVDTRNYKMETPLGPSSGQRSSTSPTEKQFKSAARGQVIASSAPIATSQYGNVAYGVPVDPIKYSYATQVQSHFVPLFAVLSLYRCQ
jgi:pyruvate/2-oxoacid:ferredoxin oxidoreductase beta subunit